MTREAERVLSGGRTRFGFTLVEVVIVALIVGILAVVAVPKIVNSHQDAMINTTMQDIRVIEEAAHRYRARNGDWPPFTYKGTPPNDFDGYIGRAIFRKEPPIGSWTGYGYIWNPNVFGTQAAVYLYNPTPPTELWLDMDEQFDDGDPDAGSIYIYSDRWLIFVVDEH